MIINRKYFYNTFCKPSTAIRILYTNSRIHHHSSMCTIIPILQMGKPRQGELVELSVWSHR